MMLSRRSLLLSLASAPTVALSEREYARGERGATIVLPRLLDVCGA